VSGSKAPRLDSRRADDFAAELQRRAHAWIPSWDLANADGDFGRALLDIAARFSAEVAERLDNAGDKMQRGFLDWLAVRGTAARPARVPVVFALSEAAKTSVLAEAPVRLQASAGAATVVFETEKDLRVAPGRLATVVGIDGDAYSLAPPGLSNLDPLDSTPTRWQPKAFTAAGAVTLQLDPDSGLAAGDFIQTGGHEYRVLKVDKDLVTIDPPLDGDLPSSEVVSKVDRFAPFDPSTRNWQKHELYLGDTDLLNIEAEATIEIVGATGLQDGVTWEYYGKVAPRENAGWQPLTPSATATGLALKKPKGAVDVCEVNGRGSRWIRARTTASSDTFTADRLALRINADRCNTPACPADPKAPVVAPEGMANTTPLVLATTFFPLGREPRQFDAFYLGSREAFSKPGANVQLCFQMAEPKFVALAALRGNTILDNLVTVGVGADGSLHLLVFDGAGKLTRYGSPRRPPSPDATGAAVAGASVELDPTPRFRPAVWMKGQALFAAVGAGHTVWMWVESGELGTPTGWRMLGEIPSAAPHTDGIQGLVYLADGAQGQLLALLGDELFRRDLGDLNGSWNSVDVTDGGAAVALAQIAPIASESEGLGGQVGEGLIGVATDGTVYGITLNGICTPLLVDADPAVAPAAVRRTGNALVAVAIGKAGAPRRVLGFLSKAMPNSFDPDDVDRADIEWPDTPTNTSPVGIAGGSIDANFTAGQLTFAFNLTKGIESAVATWVPLFNPASQSVLFRASLPSSAGAFNGAPTLLPAWILEPTMAGDVLVASYDPARRASFVAPQGAAIVTRTDPDRLLPGDYVAYHAAPVTPHYILAKIADTGIAVGELRFHPFDPAADRDEVLVFKQTATPFTGSIDTPANLKELTVDAGDGTTRNGTALLVTTDTGVPALYEVTAFDNGTGVATLDRDLDVTNPGAPPATVAYQLKSPSGATIRPTLRLDSSSNGWDPTLLARTRLLFEGADPALQTGTVLPPNAPAPPLLVALETFWTVAPPPLSLGIRFTVDAALGDWAHQLGDTSSNPELSWEYWNGTGWWTLGSVQDDTRNLKTSGAISFDVPIDLKPSDWSGKTNHWIRARLIGGDYGQEKITVVTKTTGTTSEQTVQRSTDGIRAPVVLHLHVAYGLCTPVAPAFVLAADSGSMRDLSDTNRTAGAIVEAFVPLPELLRRFSEPAAVLSPGHESCPPECGCGGQKAPVTSSARATATAPAPSAPATFSCADTAAATAADGLTGGSGRQILIGVAATLSGAPVNILLLVDEVDHAALAPMGVEVLNGDRFQPLVVNDETRALGESGVLSMSFAVTPAPRELFGHTLTWLRLSPRPGATGSWAPVLRGAYLNAVFASATETLTRELLGSSEGAPNLTVRVARPPVLHDTLELRVKEPLGDEERDRLRADEHAPTVVHAGGTDHEHRCARRCFRITEVLQSHIQQTIGQFVHPPFEAVAAVQCVRTHAVMHALVADEHVVRDEAEGERVQQVAGDGIQVSGVLHCARCSVRIRKCALTEVGGADESTAATGDQGRAVHEFAVEQAVGYLQAAEGPQHGA
jgi:hypothetical protein